VTGRRFIADALREPMRGHGWQPRAAGWFSKPLDPAHLGVLALGVASEHSPAGEAQATLYVHLRDELVERELAEICEWADGGTGPRRP
jgi:hypothetical protein